MLEHKLCVIGYFITFIISCLCTIYIGYCCFLPATVPLWVLITATIFCALNSVSAYLYFLREKRNYTVVKFLAYCKEKKWM